MMNCKSVSEQPFDPCEVRRLSYVRVGKCPDFKAGDKVWVLNGPSFELATIRRRLPGGVYWASLHSRPASAPRVIVSANTCGGAA